MPLRSRDYWTSPRLDILSELRRRNLDHLVERVVAGLDPASARAAARVSADWRQMVAEAADARRRRRRRRRRRNMERREEDRVSASRETVEGASAGVTAVAVDEEGTTVVLGTQDGSVVNPLLLLLLLLLPAILLLLTYHTRFSLFRWSSWTTTACPPLAYTERTPVPSARSHSHPA